MKTKVAIVACHDYSEENVRESVAKAIELLGGYDKLLDQRNIILKPNLCLPTHYNNNLTTHPQIIRQLGILLKERADKIIVADTPVGKSDSERREKLWEVTGINEVLRELKLERSDLEERLVMHDLKIEDELVSFPVSSAIFDNQIINVPKFKTHGFMLFTGGVKNLYGVLPEYSKKRLHRELEEKNKFSQFLLELYRMANCKFHIMDAVVGIQGEGPGAKGEPREIGLIMASEDGVALDSVAAVIMNTEPHNIPTNFYAQELGIGQTDLSEIDIVGGEIGNYIIRDFKLPLINEHTDRISQKLFHLSRYSVEVNEDKCRKCGLCEQNCPSHAINMTEDTIAIKSEKCKSCLVCHEICPFGAIGFSRYSFLAELSKKEKDKKKSGTSKEKWILMFGNPDSQHMFRKIKARGYKIALIHDKEPRTDFSICDAVYKNMDYSRWEAADIAGVVNIHSERSVLRCAQVCEYYGLPGYNVEQAKILSNKKMLKTVLAEYNIKTPAHKFLHNYRELLEGMDKLKPPYVLKPVDSSNTRGVFLLQEDKISEDIFEQVLSFSESKEAVLEEFAKGEEYDVTCVVCDYEIIYLFVNRRIRHEKGQDFGKAIGFQTVTFPESKMKELEHLCRNSVKELKIKRAVVSFQLIDGEKGWSIIEVAGRLMGGGIFEFIYFVTGIDMDSILLDLALDKPIRAVSKKECRPAAYLFADSLLDKPQDIHKKLEGFDEVRKVPGVFLVNIMDKAVYSGERGEEYKELSGGVLCFGNSDEAALDTAFASFKRLKWI